MGMSRDGQADPPLINFNINTRQRSVTLYPRTRVTVLDVLSTACRLEGQRKRFCAITRKP